MFLTCLWGVIRRFHYQWQEDREKMVMANIHLPKIKRPGPSQLTLTTSSTPKNTTTHHNARPSFSSISATTTITIIPRCSNIDVPPLRHPPNNERHHRPRRRQSPGKPPGQRDNGTCVHLPRRSRGVGTDGRLG